MNGRLAVQNDAPHREEITAMRARVTRSLRMHGEEGASAHFLLEHENQLSVILDGGGTFPGYQAEVIRLWLEERETSALAEACASSKAMQKSPLHLSAQSILVAFSYSNRGEPFREGLSLSAETLEDRRLLYNAFFPDDEVTRLYQWITAEIAVPRRI